MAEKCSNMERMTCCHVSLPENEGMSLWAVAEGATFHRAMFVISDCMLSKETEVFQFVPMSAHWHECLTHCCGERDRSGQLPSVHNICS